MEKKSKVLMWILILATLTSVGFTFYKTIILNDFVVVEDTEVVEE